MIKSLGKLENNDYVSTCKKCFTIVEFDYHDITFGATTSIPMIPQGHYLAESNIKSILCPVKFILCPECKEKIFISF